jgi:hypothetical protein
MWRKKVSPGVHSKCLCGSRPSQCCYRFAALQPPGPAPPHTYGHDSQVVLHIHRGPATATLVDLLSLQPCQLGGGRATDVYVQQTNLTGRGVGGGRKRGIRTGVETKGLESEVNGATSYYCCATAAADNTAEQLERQPQPSLSQATPCLQLSPATHSDTILYPGHLHACTVAALPPRHPATNAHCCPGGAAAADLLVLPALRTSLPCAARANASCVAKVLLPTPPLPDSTNSLFLT